MDTRDILAKHKHLNFVRRIIDPNIYPNIDNEDGSVSTHRMAYGEAEGKYYVYPTIIQDKRGKLQQLDDKAAWDYAAQTNERIEFDKEEDAAKFAKGGYKEGWNKPLEREETF